ncbi:uncharacterized protein LOC125229718 isoform X2 [Leguminivora glycinivorella]|uniref:uncharacterized protein LOC125226295 isoform X2 n=3 Tax=Leguminivora glycinivorella TaxID=1035111 RepID=UPI00200C5864|nr:uncharacterized protein LOC125226295 isoform X2 [Leguminivora glycinivorella]XP_047990608.1 uncharacterized protein LOC125229718 isoform X2 [Leguminivora glycinivorella]
MAKTVGKVACFEMDGGNWQTYCDRLDMYFLVNKVEDNMKLPTLISCIGDSAYELMVNLCSPKKPCDCKYDEVIKVMANYLQPKPSVVAERFKFRQCRQSSGQSVANFMAELKKASKYCDFGANLDDNMRDQFVCGINSDFVRQRLFAEESLSYSKAVTIATTLEAAERDSHAIGDKDNASDKNDVKSVHKIQPVSAGRSLCEACGDPHHKQSECKFSQYVCDVCKIRGHLRRMCPQVMRGSSFGANRRGNGGRGAANRARSWRGGWSGRGGGARSGLHWVQGRDAEAEQEDFMESERERDGEAVVNLMSLNKYKPA